MTEKTNEQSGRTGNDAQVHAGRDVHVEQWGDTVRTEGGDYVRRDKIVYEGWTAEQVSVLIAELREEDQPTVWDGRNPYLGLNAFRESDAPFFFGRESLVDDLLQRVQEAHFIVISGPSGSGKSSVARAGLFHALREGRVERSNTWLLGTMQPRGDPLEEMARAVERMHEKSVPGTGDYLRAQGMDNPLALQQQVETLLSEDERQRGVLLVDQFEEVFTQTKDDAVRTAFIDLLTAAAQADGSRAIVVLSLRSDFVSHCARFPELRALMSQQFQLVGAMEPPDLAKAITLPALEVGAEIDPALVSQIMTDMEGEPGALPLMSFALRDLFEAEKTVKGESMDLTRPEYVDRGGIERALERHANDVFASFSEEQKGLARSIFSKLIEVGQGRVDTRRTATFQELIPAGAEAGEVSAVVGVLAEEGVRLITTSGVEDEEALAAGAEASQTTVTIAHEKLIDAWPWLRQLVDENRELIALQNWISRDAQAWEEAERDAGFLYRDSRMLQVDEKLDALRPSLDALSQAFIQAGLDEWRRELEEEEARRQRELEHERALAEANAARAERSIQLAKSRQTGNRLLVGLVATLALALAIVLVPVVRREIARREARGDMVTILASEDYLFGSASPNDAYSESPEQRITIPAFAIEEYEVTNARYRRCVDWGDCALPSNVERFQDEALGDHPVTGVTAIEAATFCAWIGRRLPTELEWERVARGRDSTLWPWGDEPLASVRAVIGRDYGTTRPVGSFPESKSTEDVYDLIGNVWEWTASYKSPRYDTDTIWSGDWQELNPQIPLIRRGMSFEESVDLATVTWRPSLLPTEDGESVGFRCAASAGE